MGYRQHSWTGALGAWIAAAGLLGSAGVVRGENGDVVGISNVLTGIPLSDITFDQKNPVGGSFWALGERSGKIYHLSLDLSTKIGEINNPHGTGSFPNFILSRGISYRPTTNTLLVLAQESGVWRIREVGTDGTEVAEGAFTMAPPDPGSAGLRGLAYDTLARELWYLDANNDKVVRADLSGNAALALDLPGDVPVETIIRGEGIGFELEQISPGVFEPRIYVTYGDIFHSNPSRILQLTNSGQVTGIEIPLGNVPPSLGLRGFQTYRAGAQRRAAIVTAEGKIVQVDQVVPMPVPPSLLQCSVSLTNKVNLSWQNNGNGALSTYEEIIILRNGVPFVSVPGNTSSFVDETPLEGTSTYALKASEAAGGPFSPPGSDCEVTVGTSGIVRWAPFPGAAPYDVAKNPATGDVYATDNVGFQGQGRIFRFDEGLALLGEVPSPWSRPGPIAFVPSIQIQSVTLQNILAVGRTDGVLVKLMDESGTEMTTISLETGVADPLIGSLTYMPATEEFAFMELTQQEIKVVDKSGRLLRTCIPNPILGLPAFDAGVTYDPVQDTFLAVFQPVAETPELFVREVRTGGSCVPTGFAFNLSSLGERSTVPQFLGGIEISGNTLLAIGRDSNAIFQVLIFPFGPPFQRGDFDRNGSVNLTDAIALANYLFKSGPPPTCADAADTNDDGVLDIGDPILLLFYLYLQGAPPPQPFPDASSDPTFRDNLGCEE